MNSAQTYDDLAEHYHLIFEDWNSSIERQAAVLSSILQQNLGSLKSARVLDCACGQLVQAARQMRAKLIPGGVLMASIRDYDRLMIEKPVVQGPSFYENPGFRRIVFQVWDWTDDRQYAFHLYITNETVAGWQTFHTAGLYRAIRRDKISAALKAADFKNVRWLSPTESGFYQPIVLAVAN